MAPASLLCVEGLAGGGQRGVLGAPSCGLPQRRRAVRHRRPPRRGGLRPGSARQPSAAGAAAPCCHATPQRAGEAAWHRRRRRQRGAARTLLRVAAAAQLLQRHHSSAPSMGGGRRGGGTGGGSGAGGGGGGDSRRDDDLGKVLRALEQQSAQQQQLLQALGSGGLLAGGAHAGRLMGAGGPGQRARQDGGGGGGRGQRPSSRGGASGEEPGRPFDWGCRACGFTPNFARRQHCLQCGAARPRATAAHSGTVSGGPVGANGLRPMLAWGSRGGNQASPTHRLPGSSVAAVAEAAAVASAAAARAPPAAPAPRPSPVRQQQQQQPQQQPASAARATAGLGFGGASSAQVAAPAAAAAPGGVGSPGGPGMAHSAHLSTAEGPRVPGPGDAKLDSDGFTVVTHGRRGAGGRGVASGSAQAGPPAALAAHDMQVDEGGAGLEEEGIGEQQSVQPIHVGDPAGDDDGALDEAGGGEDGDDDGAEATAATLKCKLDEEVAMVKWLEREGVAPEHPSMRAALAARDAAERSWRAARSPQPVGKRMGWAQARLDRALRQQERVVQELAIFDSEVKAHRDKIGERLLAAKARVSKQREALESLQEEAASLVLPTDKHGRGRQVCSQAADGIAAKVAPHLLELAAAVPAGTTAATKLAEVMGHIEAIQLQLRSVAGEGGEPQGNRPPESRAPHQAFDIGDGATSEAWSESHELDERCGGTSTAGAGKAQGQTPNLHWQTRGFGRWAKGSDTGAGSAAAEPAGGGEATAGGTAQLPGAAPLSQPCAATRGRTVDSAAGVAAMVGVDGIGRADDDQSTGQPAAKARKGQTAEDSEDAAAAVQHTRRAVECMAQQAAAASAAASTADAAALARQQMQAHAGAVAAVTNRAIAQGVQPVTVDGNDLIVLDAEELARWAAEHLGPEAGW